MSNYVSDDSFLAFANEAEAADKNRGSFTNGNRTSNYEEIKWVGCDTNRSTICRFVGGAPDSHIDNYTAKTVNISFVLDDYGKKMKLVSPRRTDDPNYIINRIIAQVLGPKWVNRQKVYPVKESHPEIYNLIDKCGLQESDPRYKYERGWKGREVVIANVIDRSDMDWHRANKHTKLLAKQVTISQDGREFADEGVSSYALLNKLSHLFRAYGSWEKYDIAITRTGKMDNPFILINATNSPMEVSPMELKKYVSNNNHLTDEEAAWERYDLNKLYAPTTATKIFSRMKNTIKRIDAALGTNFYEELQKLSEKEKAEWEKENKEKEQTGSTVTISSDTYEDSIVWDDVPVVEAPVVESTRPVVRRTSTIPIAPSLGVTSLPYYTTMSASDQALVKSVKHEEGSNFYDIEWGLPAEEVGPCPVCSSPSPLYLMQCPCCGQEFQEA